MSTAGTAACAEALGTKHGMQASTMTKMAWGITHDKDGLGHQP